MAFHLLHQLLYVSLLSVRECCVDFNCRRLILWTSELHCAHTVRIAYSLSQLFRTTVKTFCCWRWKKTWRLLCCGWHLCFWCLPVTFIVCVYVNFMSISASCFVSIKTCLFTIHAVSHLLYIVVINAEFMAFRLVSVLLIQDSRATARKPRNDMIRC